ncbi:YgaP family membrane protein [Pseudaestuariivita atlantica]|uniref:YgaP family membrane protein n=1 Tax=Pseudaestuariivita atlantica TaxID=1317121 RepID=UPI0009E36AA0
MTRNLGKADRLIRFFLGLLLVVAPLANLPPIWGSTLSVVLAMAVGAVLIVTSFVQFCPLYRIFGISTCKL